MSYRRRPSHYRTTRRTTGETTPSHLLIYLLCTVTHPLNRPIFNYTFRSNLTLRTYFFFLFHHVTFPFSPPTIDNYMSGCWQSWYHHLLFSTILHASSSRDCHRFVTHTRHPLYYFFILFACIPLFIAHFILLNRPLIPPSLPLFGAITHCRPSRAIQNSFAGTAVSGGRRCGIHPHRWTLHLFPPRDGHICTPHSYNANSIKL